MEDLESGEWRFPGTILKSSAVRIALGIVALIAVIFGMAALIDGYRTVEEGYVGVYSKFGALRDRITKPGNHFCQAFVTTTRKILIRPEELKMPSVKVITKDGIEI